MYVQICFACICIYIIKTTTKQNITTTKKAKQKTQHTKHINHNKQTKPNLQNTKAGTRIYNNMNKYRITCK